MKKITARDIARGAGVSPSTVSRVLNNSANVDPQTRQLVLDAARRSGFPVCRRGEDLTVGVIGQFPHEHLGGYFGLILGAVCEAVSRRGGHVALASPEDVSLLNERAVWGAVNLSSDNRVTDFWCAGYALPLVNVNLHARPASGVGAVIMKDDDPVREAVHFLWKKGHRRIAYFTCESMRNEMTKPSRRWHGYVEGMHAHGVEHPEEDMVFASVDDMEPGFLELLARKFTAVVFPYEIANLYLEPCLRKFRVKIPEDLSIVQWEYPLVSQILTPPRSTICHNHRLVAEEAVSLLYDMIRRKAPPREIFVPSTFLNRESIAAPKVRRGRRARAGE